MNDKDVKCIRCGYTPSCNADGTLKLSEIENCLAKYGITTKKNWKLPNSKEQRN